MYQNDELRSLALRDLNIPVDEVRSASAPSCRRSHGDLRLQSTWLSAIASVFVPKTEEPATENVGTTPVLGDLAPFVPAAAKGAYATCPHFRDKLSISPNLAMSLGGYTIAPVRGAPKTEFASLIGHPVMCGGELREVADGWDYFGYDDRGLPQALVDEETGILYPFEEFDALPIDLGSKYFLHCLRNRLQLPSYLGVAA